MIIYKDINEIEFVLNKQILKLRKTKERTYLPNNKYWALYFGELKPFEVSVTINNNYLVHINLIENDKAILGVSVNSKYHNNDLQKTVDSSFKELLEYISEEKICCIL